MQLVFRVLRHPGRAFPGMSFFFSYISEELSIPLIENNSGRSIPEEWFKSGWTLDVREPRIVFYRVWRIPR